MANRPGQADNADAGDGTPDSEEEESPSSGAGASTPSRPAGGFWSDVATEAGSAAEKSPSRPTSLEKTKSRTSRSVILRQPVKPAASAEPPPDSDAPEHRPTSAKALETKQPPESHEEPADADEDSAESVEGSANTGEDSGDLDEDTARPSVFATTRTFVGNHFATLLASLVAVILAVALILTMLQVSDKNSLENARSTALSAAKTYAVEVGGYNYKQLGKDFGRVLSNSTPAWRHSYSQAANALKQTLVKYKASAVATVTTAGIVSATTTSATVLIFLSQKVSNTEEKSATTTKTQVQMSLLWQNGKWLINNVTIL